MFFEELERLGWAEGDTIIVERWSAMRVADIDGRAEIIRRILASSPDIVVTSGSQWAPQMARIITTIPMVVAVADRWSLAS